MVLTSDKEDYVNSKGWHKVKAASCRLSSVQVAEDVKTTLVVGLQKAIIPA